MEKLIYVLVGGGDDIATRMRRIADSAVPAAREIAGQTMSILIPDRTDEIRSRHALRIGGDFDSLAAVFECWVPALDVRAPVEEALRPFCDSLWGYLVTESAVAACPHACEEGGRVPGITQWGINDKPVHVTREDFYREWQDVQSKLSFDLHPTRDSYIRNSIARKLTAEAPTYLGIVLERFPSLDDYADDARYFGEPSVVKKMIEHLPSFYDFGSAITGGMSEFRFS